MRITGGTHRSRALRAPKGTGTRPTSDRVREALFGVLASAGVIEGARVLDLYAGTGALAFEALSRGADRATVVESAREALAVLRANAASLRFEGKVHILPVHVSAAVPRLTRDGPFDLVFVDPPWAMVDSGSALRDLERLVASGALSERVIVVLEHSSRTQPAEVPGLAVDQTRRYGDTALTLYKPAILAQPRMHARRPSE
jgi:16S rRNA (guanine966-N2)-methyltransferase